MKKVIKNERAAASEDAHIVRRIFEQFAAGMTSSEICAALNREGVPVLKGRVRRPTFMAGCRIAPVKPKGTEPRRWTA